MFNYSVIMAAGDGKRLLPLTKDHPKALLDVNDKFLISYTLEQLASILKYIYVTIGKNGSKIKDLSFFDVSINLIDTSDQGNSWWLFNTLLKSIDHPVLVFPCDIITKIDLGFIYDQYVKLGSPVCMIVPVKPVEDIEGDFIFGNNCLVKQLSREIESEIYCSGIQVINPFQVNNAVKEYSDFYDLWRDLICQGLLKYCDVYPHHWYSINTIDQLNFFECKVKNPSSNKIL